VPQGSVLGPVLFLAYINDLPGVLTTAKANLYADDTVVYGSSSTPGHLENVINTEMANVTCWFDQNGLQLNAKKTVMMTFGKKLALAKFSKLKVTLDGESLAMAETTKYLGMWLDSTLSFDCHVNDVCKRSSMALGTIGRVKRLLPKDTRATLVNAVVTPIFDYGAVLLRNIAAAASNRLQ
jgi:hypothetical protein